MTLIYIVSDSQALKNDVVSALGGKDTVLVELSSGEELLELLKEERPDLIVLDLQIANMGATAITLDIRLAESDSGADPAKILVLLDRRADVFMTRRSRANGFVVKPFDSLKLKRAVKAVLETGQFEDSAFAPSN